MKAEVATESQGNYTDKQIYNFFNIEYIGLKNTCTQNYEKETS
jgi:hypothetical protein